MMMNLALRRFKLKRIMMLKQTMVVQMVKMLSFQVSSLIMEKQALMSIMMFDSFLLDYYEEVDTWRF
jgi:hypothetical protein